MILLETKKMLYLTGATIFFVVLSPININNHLLQLSGIVAMIAVVIVTAGFSKTRSLMEIPLRTVLFIAPFYGLFEKYYIKQPIKYSLLLLVFGLAGLITERMLYKVLPKFNADFKRFLMKKTEARTVTNCFTISFGFRSLSEKKVFEQLVEIEEKLSDYDTIETIRLAHYLGTNRLYYIIGFPSNRNDIEKAFITVMQIKHLLKVSQSLFPFKETYIGVKFGEVTIKMKDIYFGVFSDSILELVNMQMIESEREGHLLQMDRVTFRYFQRYFPSGEEIHGDYIACFRKVLHWI